MHTIHTIRNVFPALVMLDIVNTHVDELAVVSYFIQVKSTSSITCK